ncbi:MULTISPECIES: hypothetical protein [Nitrobacteraceae]|uniref:Uncharacterized protein n=1 Tax=Rhodopseudomonas palustris TaxID=1076 RepID=A0A0D7F1N2_RHOPL|nr:MULTISPECIES: hypothetical protein [Nitrobacteraceae]MCW5703810.1 hypothetical protein [Bradyrhizobium sp.]KIZ46695.1 hypothetical protein OO17_06315 [Rhodopseudomonas palustris]KQW18081.1 hypothetical protein ASC80_21845 [Afipia sp. Root123D2]MDF3811996.1 hypothetical protein [Rhodopseudomonas sp. BAL398]WOK21062.1 hypothetical protein RBJ75_29190 [Rhodopseudomonas sp. BAL398]
MKLQIAIIATALLFSVPPALADIPVNDAAQLTQRSQTAGTTVKLVPVTTQRQDANSSVKCAVTTGKKANVTDPTVQPQSGAGAQAIQSYGPDLPVTPDPGAQGATLNSQTLFKLSGDVVAGLDASRQTMTAAQSAFQASAQQVGTAPTVMAAIDMNSAARLQNNLVWNGAIGSANLWVTALNALNLALNSDMSQAALGMRATVTSTQPATGPACPVGMIGAGTAANPCRPPTACSTTPPGSSPDPSCVSARYVDSNGNVIFYLAQAQTAATGANAGATAALSVADVTAALGAISANSR